MAAVTNKIKAGEDRVLILTERFFPENFIINDLVLAFKKRGLVFDVLTQQPSYPHGDVSAYPGYKNSVFSVDYWNEIKIYRIMTIQGYKKNKLYKLINYFNFSFFCSIVLFFIGRKYNKIFVFHSGPLTMAAPAIIGKKIFGTANIIWSLDLWPDTVYMYGFKKSKLNKSVLDFIVKKTYKQFDAIYCSSHGFVEIIQNYAGKKLVKTLMQWPQNLDNNRDEKEILLDPEYFHFTFAGNIAWTQNLENVILGFSIAQHKNDKIHLNIVGDGSDLERLKGIVAGHHIKNVIFWGWQQPDKMPSIFEQSDVLVLSLQPDPVYDRYVPLKFSTYLACHKPIFAIMKGIVKELTEENRIGIVAHPSSLEEIDEGFDRFGSMTLLEREEYGSNSDGLLADQFNREKNINILFEELRG